jgi:hypothetical protein
VIRESLKSQTLGGLVSEYQHSLTGAPSTLTLSKTCEIFATLGKSFHPDILQSGFPASLSRSYNRWGRGMVSHFINEPQHWRTRAEEARVLANHMDDSEAKVAMLRIAQEYEHLARRAEDRALGRLSISTLSNKIGGTSA